MDRRAWIQASWTWFCGTGYSAKLWAVEKIERLDSEWRNVTDPRSVLYFAR